MFLIPWISDPRGDKTGKGGDAMAPQDPKRKPIVEIPMLNKLKRKRADSQDSANARRGPGIAKPPGEGRHASGLQGVSDNVDEVSLAEICSQDVLGAPVAPNIGHATNGTATGTFSEADVEMPDSQPVEQDVASLTPLQQTIEEQFSLEILLKHNELRLIDQELAKCQIALEQLRRCQVIPFPDSSSQSGWQAVSNGSGPALEPEAGQQRAQYPPPWGVTDGPYTRHYAKWLIPDQKFDGGPEELDQELMPAGKTVPPGRSTRGSITEPASVGGKSRAQRGSAGSKLQALSNGYAQPREKAGPLIVKRSSDGQSVKLVCLDCNRGDFSSAQGFINHCRIAHHRGFESHDAAAIACGQVVEVDEAGGVVVGGGGPEPPTTNGVGFVHPLIRTAASPNFTGNPSKPSKVTRTPTVNGTSPGAKGQGTTNGVAAPRPRAKQVRSRNGAGSVHKKSSFVPSPEAPHLSALMERRGFGGDLGDMVSQARTQLDLGIYSSSDDDDTEDWPVKSEDTEAMRCNGGLRRMRRPSALDGAHDENDRPAFLNASRMPARSGMSPAPFGGRPSSSKGVDRRSRKAARLGGISTGSSSAAPHATSGGVHLASSSSSSAPRMPLKREADDDIEEEEEEDEMPVDGSPTTSNPLNLSPNTIETNPAPSLVSDDGDYEAHSESESPSSAEAEDEDGYLDHVEVEVEDEDDDAAGACGSETTATDPELANSAKAMRTRRSSAAAGAAALRERVGRGNAQDGRHVSFVSPVKDGRGGGGGRGGGRSGDGGSNRKDGGGGGAGRGRGLL
ncbi:MAG: hypothetical protein M1819_001960 [Sarea resinae]|nr:MAG: hypothetical protein M1819_001960 [Sarea resinae]